MKILLTLAIVGAALVLAAPAAAINPGSGQSVITLDQPDPVFGQTIDFSFVATDNGPVYPYIELRCSQNGKMVLDTVQDGLMADSFVLSSAKWTGGSAKCTALLENQANGFAILDKLNFGVAG